MWKEYSERYLLYCGSNTPQQQWIIDGHSNINFYNWNNKNADKFTKEIGVNRRALSFHSEEYAEWLRAKYGRNK